MQNKFMNITYVTMQWPCASETFAARDILALRELGHHVNVLALRHAPHNSDYILTSQMTMDVPSCSLNILGYATGILKALQYPKILYHFMSWIFRNEKSFKHRGAFVFLTPSFFWAVDEIIKIQPDIVHLFWGHYPSGVAEILKLRLKDKCPHITIFLGAYDLNMGLSLSKKIAQSSDAAFTHAKENIKYFKNMNIPPENINVIHRGIDVKSMDDLTSQLSFPARDPLRLVFVGRLVKEKNVESILHAMKMIIKKYPDICLDVIGDGPEIENLKNLAGALEITTHTKFYGYLSPIDVYQKLYQCSYLVFPSISAGERLPNAVKEAMYAGVVPIVSNTPGIDELITHANNGFILESTTPECICHTLLEVLESHDWKNISESAHNTIVDNFDVRKSMSRYIDVWKSL